MIELAEEVEVEAETEEEAEKLAVAKTKERGFNWDECERRVMYEDVQRVKSFD